MSTDASGPLLVGTTLGLLLGVTILVLASTAGSLAVGDASVSGLLVGLSSFGVGIGLALRRIPAPTTQRHPDSPDTPESTDPIELPELP